ncbi:hypothetical protein [Deinococcus roseus]|uniref:Uncharacterized protein n=1 Tax=Deinococcus roseus TaxID=392414 RepID=A0ABQ2D5U8_9DEIO|nr:hypothetical protein [Deinococcus roseus]GGJ44641.1 hypothetical protein GCM10008938_33520 [Deinococcus roseus]
MPSDVLTRHVKVLGVLAQQGLPVAETPVVVFGSAASLLLQALQHLPVRHQLVLLDLQDIYNCTLAVATAWGPALQMALPHLNMVYVNGSPKVLEALHLAFLTQMARNRQPCRVALAYTAEKTPMLLGDMPDHLWDVFYRMCVTSGGLTATLLGEVGVEAPSKKLTDLIQKYPQLVQREKHLLQHGAWGYRYTPVVQPDQMHDDKEF